MLNPDSSVLLTEALRPPVGYEMDVAVATTYSLDLTAMLIAPMTFALGSVEDAGVIDSGDRMQLLDALGRGSDRITVFCQAAAIHVPASHSGIHTFLEGSIAQVEPPCDNALFHPKVWAVRYQRKGDGALFHRVIVASRNLTLDNSWDTALVLDEAPDGEIGAGEVAGFVGKLPALCLKSLTDRRRKDIDSLVESMGEVRFAVPQPFTSGELVALGTGDENAWPFTGDADRVLAMSPFLASGTLRRIRGDADEATLISRPEALDELGAQELGDWDLSVLSPGVDLVSGETDPDTGSEPETDGDDLTGLHAKVVVTDHADDTSRVVTGSANLTEAAWTRNVEFAAVLTGPTTYCGVDAVLGTGSGDTGLAMITEPYSPVGDNPDADPSDRLRWQLENFHRALAQSDPRIDVLPRDGAFTTVRLTLTVPEDAPGETEVWLSTVANNRRKLTEQVTWTIAEENITPFIGVQTTVGEGERRVTRKCIIMVPVINDTAEHRRRRALNRFLDSPDRVLRYLSFLLGMDDTRQVVAAEDRSDVVGSLLIADEDAPKPPRQLSGSVALFEPLVRAVTRDPEHLDSVADRIAEIRSIPGADRVVPDDFLRMWDVVLKVVGKGSTK